MRTVANTDFARRLNTLLQAGPQQRPATRPPAEAAAAPVDSQDLTQLSPAEQKEVHSASEKFARIKTLMSGVISAPHENKVEILEILRAATGRELNLILSFVNMGELLSQMDNHNIFVEDPLYVEMLNLLCRTRKEELAPDILQQVISALLVGFTSSQEQNQILHLFQNLSKDKLNALLMDLDLPAFFKQMTLKLYGSTQYVSLLRTICETRAPDLSGAAKARIIAGFLKGPMHGKDEKAILQLLRTASKSELNDILASIGPASLLDGISDHLLGSKNKQALLQLLTSRAADISWDAKAALVGVLRKSPLGGESEACVRQIFLTTSGRELTLLKDAIDNNDAEHDLHMLIYSQLNSEETREVILQHIATEARNLQLPESKVYTDGQANVLQNNQHDRRYPAGASYPGATAFYAGLNGVASACLLGKPLARLAQHRALFPEYMVILVADSRYESLAAINEQIDSAEIRFKTIFVQDVTGLSPEVRSGHKARNIEIFDTYIGAALAGKDRGLISSEGVFRVASEALKEFEAANLPPAQHNARREEFQRDIQAWNSTALLSQRLQMH